MTMIPLIRTQKNMQFAGSTNAQYATSPQAPQKANVATIHKENSGRISCVAHV